MLSAPDRTTVICDEGWSVRQLGAFSVGYREEGRGELAFGLDLGMDWTWDSEDATTVADHDARNAIIERLRRALEFLGYAVNTYTLEVMSGLRVHGLCTVPLGGGRVRCSIGERALTVQLKEIDADRVEVLLSDLQRWDPPFQDEPVSTGDLNQLMSDLTLLVAQYGRSLLVTK